MFVRTYPEWTSLTNAGGGIAFYMAQKYPEIISHCFLLHSIPLNGFHSFNEEGKATSPEDLADFFASAWPNDLTKEAFLENLKPYSSNVPGLPPISHPILSYLASANVMKCKIECMMANVKFNATPIKSPYSEPSNALETLKSKVIVLHGSIDSAVPAAHVEHVTKLAIAEAWAPSGMLSYYDTGEGHMLFWDNPTSFASVYRKAFDEQVLPMLKVGTLKADQSSFKEEHIQVASQ